MSFIPVLIMALILLIITILLSIADRLLVTYGECKITVTQEDEKKEFVVQGGGYLHSSLIENGLRITTSCGGKATCGYCKVNVLSGGGRMLPTEEIFMNRREKVFGIRLACQVKVKNDIEIYIPDFLTTVRNMVENRTYDPKLKWRFITAEQVESIPEKRKVKLEHEQRMKTDAIIEEYKGIEGAIVPVLQRVNDTFNYLPELVLKYLAEQLDIPLSVVFRIATFYNAFSLEPIGKYKITVCLGTACHVKGAGDILSAFENELGIKTGETTEDMLFTLERVRCLGCCGLAPVLKINEDVHGLVAKKQVPKLIEMYLD